MSHPFLSSASEEDNKNPRRLAIACLLLAPKSEPLLQKQEPIS